MNPYQTAPKQSDMGPYCLQYRLPKNISRQEQQTTKVVNGGLRIKNSNMKFENYMIIEVFK